MIPNLSFYKAPRSVILPRTVFSYAISRYHARCSNSNSAVIWHTILSVTMFDVWHESTAWSNSDSWLTGLYVLHDATKVVKCPRVVNLDIYNVLKRAWFAIKEYQKYVLNFGVAYDKILNSWLFICSSSIHSSLFSILKSQSSILHPFTSNLL